MKKPFISLLTVVMLSSVLVSCFNTSEISQSPSRSTNVKQSPHTNMTPTPPPSSRSTPATGGKSSPARQSDTDPYKKMSQAGWMTFAGKKDQIVLPLYAISGDYGVNDQSVTINPTLPLPVIDYEIPDKLSGKLAAYWMSMAGNSQGLLILGPIGWKAAAAEEGTNGSIRITLVNPSNPAEKLDYEDSGACQGCTISAIGSYFPNLAKWADDQGFPGADYLPFQYRQLLSPDLTAYSLKTKSRDIETNGVAYQNHAESGNAIFHSETVTLPKQSHGLAALILNYFVHKHQPVIVKLAE